MYLMSAVDRIRHLRARNTYKRHSLLCEVSSERIVLWTFEEVLTGRPMLFPQAHCPVLSGQAMPALTTDPTRLDIWQIHLSMSSMCHYKAYSALFHRHRNYVARSLIYSVPFPTFAQEIDCSCSIALSRTNRLR